MGRVCEEILVGLGREVGFEVIVVFRRPGVMMMMDSGVVGRDGVW